MEAFQQAADRGTGTAIRTATVVSVGLMGVACGRGKFQGAAEVFVPEAVGDVVAIQDRGEQFEIVAVAELERRFPQALID